MKLLFSLIICFTLISCSNNKFACKAGHGLGCTPARKVYKIIERGEIKQAIKERNNKTKSKGKWLYITTQLNQVRPLKVWVAPQKDDEGNIIPEQYIEFQD